MSEGERVVFERLLEGTPNDNPEHYTEEDGCFQPCPGNDPENVSGVYRRIPDPVPGLQARIAELEAVLVAAKELPVLAVCQCQSQVQREVMDLGWKMVEIYRRIDAALKPPTPAASKEQ